MIARDQPNKKFVCIHTTNYKRPRGPGVLEGEIHISRGQVTANYLPNRTRTTTTSSWAQSRESTKTTRHTHYGRLGPLLINATGPEEISFFRLSLHQGNVRPPSSPMFINPSILIRNFGVDTYSEEIRINRWLILGFM